MAASQSSPAPFRRTECKKCGETFNSPLSRGPVRSYCPECQPRDDDGKRVAGVKSLECKKCGKVFQSERKKKYCSVECQQLRPKKEFRPLACLWCEKNFEPVFSKQRFCCKKHGNAYRNLHERRKHIYTCEGCGCQYRPKQVGRKRFCSRECYFTHIGKNGPISERVIELRALAELHAVSDGYYTWANQWKVCQRCRAPFFGHKAAVYCSGACRQVYEPVGSKTVVCTTCNKPFQSSAGRNPTRCKRCIRRAASKVAKKKYGKEFRKKARVLGVPYEPVNRLKVFERDGYKCGICGRKTKKGKKVPHPRAPTLDHIVPMAKGGGHLYSNVQCACFACNWLASDSLSNKQLTLNV